MSKREVWVVEWQSKNMKLWGSGGGYRTRHQARKHAARLRPLFRVRVVKYVPAEEKAE